MHKSILTPAEYLGFEVGADRKLADWAEIASYFEMLGELSARVCTTEIGRSTKGNPFLVSRNFLSRELRQARGIQGDTETAGRCAYHRRGERRGRTDSSRQGRSSYHVQHPCYRGGGYADVDAAGA